MVTIYTTFDRDPVFGIGSLPLEVHQRTMAFRGPDIGQVVYAIFDITNASDLTPEGPYTIEDAWMGYDSDTDVGVRFADDLASVLFDRVNGADTLVLDIGITWDSDFDETNFTGQPGFAGIAMIQTPGNPYDGIDNDGNGVVDESPWNGIDDDVDGRIDEPDEVDEIGLVNFSRHCHPSVPCIVNDPQSDESGYRILSCYLQNECFETETAMDIRFMVSSGPFDWLPRQTVRFVIAYVFSEPTGNPTYLELIGDPPRPDPNDPILDRLIEVIQATREFWFSGIENYHWPLDVYGTTDLQDTNNPSGPYRVATNVVDTVGIEEVSIFYSTDGISFIETFMAPFSGVLYTGNIPGLPLGTTVSYYIEAIDSLSYMARDPEDAPDTTFSFEIVDLPTLTDITDSSGLSLPGVLSSAVWFDYDLDGDEDLFASTPAEPFLYRNDGNFWFTEVTSEAGIRKFWGAVGVQTGDYDNDGNLDLYMLSPVETNSLYRNNGDGTFEDMADEAGVDIQFGTYGAIWGDYDGSGTLDLFVFGSSSVTPLLFSNNGDGTFTDQTEFASIGGNGYSIIPTDLGRDGYLDLYNGNLYRNEGYPLEIGRNWLGVELEGVLTPRDGTGSLVEVVTGNLRQLKVYGEGTGNSMGSLPVEFGLDSAQVVDRVSVHWSSGIVQELTDVAVNQIITIEEDSSLVGIGGDGEIISPSLPRVFSLSQNYPNPFNPSTTIRYDIPDVAGAGIPAGNNSVPVEISIYDVRGRLVRKLVDKEREPGRYKVHWNGHDEREQPVGSGVYLYRIKAGPFISTKKMVITR